MSARTELPKPATTSADGSATTSTDVHTPLIGGALRWNEPANSVSAGVAKRDVQPSFSAEAGERS